MAAAAAQSALPSTQLHSRPKPALPPLCATVFAHSTPNPPLPPQFSRDSKANGALMRITPLAVWGCGLSDDELAAAAIEDAKLSHPNPVTQQANAIYCIAIKSLIRRPGDAEAAIQAAKRWASSHACEEVRGWLRDALGTAPGPAANRMIGFVRYGFFYAFRELK